MARNLTDNVIYKYYETILHFKSAKKFVADINTLTYCLENYEPNLAINVLKKIVYKYRKSVDEFGKHLTGIVTLNDVSVYNFKTEQDLYFDLLYMLRLIIVFAAVHVGIEESILSAVEKIKKDNINLNAINLYDFGEEIEIV